MTTHFLYRPLDFNWRPEMQRALASADNAHSATNSGNNGGGSSAALEHDTYVEALMMKLPAFARASASTLVVECGYVTGEKRLNLADEAFLGLPETRTLLVNTADYINGSGAGAIGLSSSSRSGSGSVHTPPPLKVGLGADVSAAGRLSLPHSPPGTTALMMLRSGSSASASASGGGGIFAATNRNNTALLQALEHRRRLHGDETFFGMIAFQNLSRPPTDLVAPFRMGATTPTSVAQDMQRSEQQQQQSSSGFSSRIIRPSSGQMPAENYAITLARIRNDEELLRLYDEIAASSAFREAASRLSIVCFVTATPPPGSRRSSSVASSDAPIATTLGQLFAAAPGSSSVMTTSGNNSGVDVAVLLQQEHHKDALACLGIDTNSKLREPGKAAVPFGVAAEHRRWIAEKLEQLKQYDESVMVSAAASGNINGGLPALTSSTRSMQQRSENPNAGGQLAQVTRLPSSADVLVAIAKGVGLRGDSAVVSRLTSHSSSADTLGLWNHILADVNRARSSSGAAGDAAATAAGALPPPISNGGAGDGATATQERFLRPGQTASDWIIPTHAAARDEIARQQEAEAQRHAAEAAERERQQQLYSARGASVTAYVQAAAGVPPTMKDAVSNEVETLEQQVQLQKQALRWFQQQGGSVAGGSAGASPAMQMAIPPMNATQQQQQQQRGTNPFLAVPQRSYSADAGAASDPPQTPVRDSNVSSGGAVNNSSPDPVRQQPQHSRTASNNTGAVVMPPAHQRGGNPQQQQLVVNTNVNNFSEQYSPSFGMHSSDGGGGGGAPSPLQSSPQAVRTKFARAQHENEELADAKAKWLLELDRVEVAHSGAVAKRFQAARQLAEAQSRAEQLQRDISELHQAVMQERTHVEERSRALIALRRQLDLSDGATKRAEQQLADVERQEAARQRAELEEAEAVAMQRKREIDGWYERSVNFQRESEVQRASAAARSTAAVADERRRKEALAGDRSRLLQEMSQTEASLRLNEVAVAELRRKVATTSTELQRARTTQHELSVTHQDINIDQATLNRLRLDSQSLQEQIADMERAVQETEERHRVNVHTSEEVGRFGEVAAAQTHLSQVALLRADEASTRHLLYTDFMQIHSQMVRSFVRHAMEIEEETLQRQVKQCGECAAQTAAIQQAKSDAAGNMTKRKQVAGESVAKERQLEANMAAYEREVEAAAAQRKALEERLQVHHERHQSEREATAQRLASLCGTRDALLGEFLRQVDGETRRCVAQIAAVTGTTTTASPSSPQPNINNSNSNSDGMRSPSSAAAYFHGGNAAIIPPPVTVRDIPDTAPSFVAAEYARWCDEVSDIAAAEQRVHELQERCAQAETAAVVSSDGLGESRQLLLHLEQENETREAALRSLEKQVDATRAFLKNRRAELEAQIAKEHEEAEQRNHAVAAQVQAATDAVGRLKQTVRDERHRANALAAEIETVQTGSAVALLLKELNALRESNKARREVLSAVGRVGQRSGSSSSLFNINSAAAVAAAYREQPAGAASVARSATGVLRPADLHDGTQYPPTPETGVGVARRVHYPGEVAGTDVKVPFFAGQDARSPELRAVPTQGEYQAAINKARGLLERRAHLGPIPSPALSPQQQSQHRSEL